MCAACAVDMRVRWIGRAGCRGGTRERLQFKSTDLQRLTCKQLCTFQQITAPQTSRNYSSQVPEVVGIFHCALLPGMVTEALQPVSPSIQNPPGLLYQRQPLQCIGCLSLLANFTHCCFQPGHRCERKSSVILIDWPIPGMYHFGILG